MNDMRKLMEAVEQLTEDPTAGGRMSALYSDISELRKTAEQIEIDFEKYPNLDSYKEVAQEVIATSHRLQQQWQTLKEDRTDIQYPNYDEYEGKLDALVEEINQILRTDPDSWHAAIKVIKQIMNNNNIVAGDLE